MIERDADVDPAAPQTASRRRLAISWPRGVKGRERCCSAQPRTESRARWARLSIGSRAGRGVLQWRRRDGGSGDGSASIDPTEMVEQRWSPPRLVAPGSFINRKCPKRGGEAVPRSVARRDSAVTNEKTATVATSPPAPPDERSRGRQRVSDASTGATRVGMLWRRLLELTVGLIQQREAGEVRPARNRCTRAPPDDDRRKDGGAGPSRVVPAPAGRTSVMAGTRARFGAVPILSHSPRSSRNTAGGTSAGGCSRTRANGLIVKLFKK